MKLKMLPNWGKKLGFLLFFMGLIVSFTTASARNDFNEGYYSYSNEITPPEFSKPEPIFIEKSFGDIDEHFIEILIILGLLIYMMSKEKVEDDYIIKLRLESYQLTSIFGLVITIILYIFWENLKLSLDYFIILFSIFYLTIFAVKKRIY
jgi:hypothetical protein